MDIRPLTTLETPTEPSNRVKVQAARFSGGGITIVELTPTNLLPEGSVGVVQRRDSLILVTVTY